MRGRQREKAPDDSQDQLSRRGCSKTGAQVSAEQYSRATDKKADKYAGGVSREKGSGGRVNAETTKRRLRSSSLDRYSQLGERESHYQPRSGGYESDSERSVLSRRLKARHYESDHESSPLEPVRAKFKRTARERSRTQSRPLSGSTCQDDIHNLNASGVGGAVNKYMSKGQKRNQSPRGQGSSPIASNDCMIIDLTNEAAEIVDYVPDCTTQKHNAKSLKATISPELQHGQQLNKTVGRRDVKRTPQKYQKPVVMEEREEIDEGLMFECKFCDKAFYSNTDLEDHFMKHFDSLSKLHAFLLEHRQKLRCDRELSLDQGVELLDADQSVEEACGLNRSRSKQVSKSKSESKWRSTTTEKRDKASRKLSVRFSLEDENEGVNDLKSIEKEAESVPVINKLPSVARKREKTSRKCNASFSQERDNEDLNSSKLQEQEADDIKLSENEKEYDQPTCDSGHNRLLSDSLPKSVSKSKEKSKPDTKKAPRKEKGCISKYNVVKGLTGRKSKEQKSNLHMILSKEVEEKRKPRHREKTHEKNKVCSLRENYDNDKNCDKNDKSRVQETDVKYCPPHADLLKLCKRKTLKICLKRLCPTDYKKYVRDLLGSSSSDSSSSTPDLRDILEKCSKPAAPAVLDSDSHSSVYDTEEPTTQTVIGRFVKPFQTNTSIDSFTFTEACTDKMQESSVEEKAPGKTTYTVKCLDKGKLGLKRERKTRKRKLDASNEEDSDLSAKAMKVVPAATGGRGYSNYNTIRTLLNTETAIPSNYLVESPDLRDSSSDSDIMEISTDAASVVEHTDTSVLEEKRDVSYRSNSSYNDTVNSSCNDVVNEVCKNSGDKKRETKKKKSVAKSKLHSVKTGQMSNSVDDSEIEKTKKVGSLGDQNVISNSMHEPKSADLASQEESVIDERDSSQVYSDNSLLSNYDQCKNDSKTRTNKKDKKDKSKKKAKVETESLSASFENKVEAVEHENQSDSLATQDNSLPSDTEKSKRDCRTKGPRKDQKSKTKKMTSKVGTDNQSSSFENTFVIEKSTIEHESKSSGNTNQESSVQEDVQNEKEGQVLFVKPKISRAKASYVEYHDSSQIYGDNSLLSDSDLDKSDSKTKTHRKEKKGKRKKKAKSETENLSASCENRAVTEKSTDDYESKFSGITNQESNVQDDLQNEKESRGVFVKPKRSRAKASYVKDHDSSQINSDNKLLNDSDLNISDSRTKTHKKDKSKKKAKVETENLSTSFENKAEADASPVEHESESASLAAQDESLLSDTDKSKRDCVTKELRKNKKSRSKTKKTTKKAETENLSASFENNVKADKSAVTTQNNSLLCDNDQSEDESRTRTPRKDKRAKAKRTAMGNTSASSNRGNDCAKKVTKKKPKGAQDTEIGRCKDLSVTDSSLESDVFVSQLSETEDPLSQFDESQEDINSTLSSFFNSMADEGLELIESTDTGVSLPYFQTDRDAVESLQPDDIYKVESCQKKVSVPDENLSVYECLALLKTDESADSSNMEEFGLDEPDSGCSPLNIKFQLKKDHREREKPVWQLKVKQKKGMQSRPCLDLTPVKHLKKKGHEYDNDLSDSDKRIEIYLDKEAEDVRMDNINNNLNKNKMKSQLIEANEDEIDSQTCPEAEVKASGHFELAMDDTVNIVDTAKTESFVDSEESVLALPVDYPSADLFKQSLSGSDLESSVNSSTHSESVESSPTKGQSSVLYQCRVCNIRYKSISSLKLHSVKQQHLNSGIDLDGTSSVFECSFCKMNFQLENECLIHEKNCTLLTAAETCTSRIPTARSDSVKNKSKDDSQIIADFISDQGFEIDFIKSNTKVNEGLIGLHHETQVQVDKLKLPQICDTDIDMPRQQGCDKTTEMVRNGIPGIEGGNVVTSLCKYPESSHSDMQEEKCIDSKYGGATLVSDDAEKLVIDLSAEKLVIDLSANEHSKTQGKDELKTDTMKCCDFGSEPKCEIRSISPKVKRESALPEKASSRLSSDSDTVSDMNVSYSADNFEVLKGDSEMKIVLKKVQLGNFAEDGLLLNFCGSPVSPLWKLKVTDDESKSGGKHDTSEIEEEWLCNQPDAAHAKAGEKILPEIGHAAVAKMGDKSLLEMGEQLTATNIQTENEEEDLDDIEPEKSTKHKTSGKLETHEQNKSKRRRSEKTDCSKNKVKAKYSKPSSPITDFEKAITTNDTVKKSKSKKSKSKAKHVTRQVSSETTSSVESNRDLVLKKKVSNSIVVESSQPFQKSKTAQRIYMEAQRKAELQKYGGDLIELSSGKNKKKNNTLPPFSVLIESKSSSKDSQCSQTSAKSLKSDLASIGIVANQPNPKLKDIMNSFSFKSSFGTMNSSFSHSSLLNFDPLSMKIPKLTRQDGQTGEIRKLSTFDLDSSLYKSPLDSCYSKPGNQSFTTLGCNVTDTDSRLNQTFPTASSSQFGSGQQISGEVLSVNEKGDFSRSSEQTTVTGLDNYDNIFPNESDLAPSKMEDRLSSEQQVLCNTKDAVPELDVSTCSTKSDKGDSSTKRKRRLTRYQIPETLTQERDSLPKPEETPVGNSSFFSIQSAQCSMIEGLSLDMTHSTQECFETLNTSANTDRKQADIGTPHQTTGISITTSVDRNTQGSRMIKLKDTSPSERRRRLLYSGESVDAFGATSGAGVSEEQLDYEMQDITVTKSETGEISDVDSYDNVLLEDEQQSEQLVAERLDTVKEVQMPSRRASIKDSGDLQKVQGFPSVSTVSSDLGQASGSPSSMSNVYSDLGSESVTPSPVYSEVQDSAETASAKSVVESTNGNGDRDCDIDVADECSDRSDTPISDRRFSPDRSPVTDDNEELSDKDESNDEEDANEADTQADSDVSGEVYVANEGTEVLDYNDADVIDLFADEDASFLDTESVLDECLSDGRKKSRLGSDSRSRASTIVSPKDMEVESPSSPSHNDHNTIEVHPPQPQLDPDVAGSSQGMSWGPATSRWMPPGFCFHFFNNRPCRNKPCKYKHSKPDDGFLISQLPLLKKFYLAGNLDWALSMIYSHTAIAKHVPKEDVYNLFARCLQDNKVQGTQMLLKLMFKRELISQKVIDDFICFRAWKPGGSQDLWEAFQLARTLNIQPAAQAGNLLLSVLADGQAWGIFWEVLVYLSEGGAQVPGELLNAGVSAALVNPARLLPHTVTWLKEADQKLLRNLDKLLLQELCSVLCRHGHGHIADSLQFLLQSLEEPPKPAPGAGLLGDKPRHMDLVHPVSRDQGNNERRSVPRDDDPDITLWIKNVQSVGFTQAWDVLAGHYVEMCERQCPLEGRFVEEVTRALLMNPTSLGPGFRDFLYHVFRQHNQDKRENPQSILDIDSLSDMANELVVVCHNDRRWGAGCEVIAASLEHDVLALNTGVPRHEAVAAQALEICIRDDNCILALRVLRDSNLRQTRVPTQQYILGLLPGLMDLQEQCGCLEDCYKILKMAFELIFSSHPPLMYDHSSFSLTVVSTALIQKCLETQQWSTAVSVYQLFPQHSSSFSIPSLLKRYLLVSMANNSFEDEAASLFEEMKKARLYPPQSLDLPRTIVVLGFHSGTEVYLVVKDYLHGLYTCLCEKVLENQSLGPRDLSLTIRVEQKGTRPRDRMLQQLGEEEASEMSTVQSVLQARLIPPLQATVSGQALIISPQNLEAYLHTLDQTGRRQGLVFQQNIRDRLARRGGHKGGPRVNQAR